MAIRKYKPTTPGRRGSSVADFAEVTRTTPEKSLLEPLPKKGGRNKYFDVKKLEQIDGIWTATEMHMTTKKGDQTLHKTILQMENVKYGQPMDESRFSVRELEKGL